MNLSFVITASNVAPHIRQCLDSLRPCLRQGDQVILVDDGSTDDTPAIVADFIAKGGFGPDITWTPIWLGTQTFGGIAIAANLGLDQARCETVFFVDSGSYLIPDAFLRARDDHAACGADIHVADYLEIDTLVQRSQRPGDRQPWQRLETAVTLEERRLAVLGLNPLPSRKFYRSAFLRDRNIRFPEGDFLFEEHPFHWAVCLAAETIGISYRVVCHHRVIGPDMNESALTAYFTHFRTILSDIPVRRRNLRLAACDWLLDGMRIHVPQLSPDALPIYAQQAEAAVKLIPDEDWSQLLPSDIWHHADRLRAGHRWDVVEAWKAATARQALAAAVTGIVDRLDALEQRVQSAHDMLAAQRAVAEFEALQHLHSRADD